MIIIRCPSPLQIRTTKTTVTSWWTDRWISVGTPQSNFSLSTNENEKNLHFSHFLHRDSYSSRIRFLSGANNGITGLEIKWNFTLYSYQLKRNEEGTLLTITLGLLFCISDVLTSPPANDKKSFVHCLEELLPRRHFECTGRKQLEYRVLFHCLVKCTASRGARCESQCFWWFCEIVGQVVFRLRWRLYDPWFSRLQHGGEWRRG